jgi:hypothetical protein
MINEILGSVKTYPSNLVINCDSASLVDSGVYSNSISLYGNATLDTTNKYLSFDGNGDYALISSTANLAVGFEDFTAECWVYPIGFGTNAGDLMSVMDTRIAGGGDGFLFWLGTSDSRWAFYTASYGSQKVLYSINQANFNRWTHLAVTRSNGICYFYVNGVLQETNGTIGSPEDLSPSNSSQLHIGTAADDPGNYRDFYGYVDNIRIIKSVVLYDKQFTPIPRTTSLPKNAEISPKNINHLILTTNKSSGELISGTLLSTSSYYTVVWWDGNKNTYSSGGAFSKTSIGGSQQFFIYPSTSTGSEVDGRLYQINLSNNSLTDVRTPFGVHYATPSTAGYSKFTYVGYPYYYSRWVWVPGITGITYSFDISSNSLNNTALDQIYTDLIDGNGLLNVSDNTGVSSDTTSIATNKGYTVYGSTSPTVELLLNLNGTNGSTTFTDSGANNRSITVQNGSPSLITSSPSPKFGSASLNANSGVIGNSTTVIGDVISLDVTLEAWVYVPSTLSSYHQIIHCPYSTSTAGISFYMTSGSVYYDNGANASCSTIGSVSVGVWTHIVATKKNDKRRIYIDGVLCSEPKISSDFSGPYQVYIGAAKISGSFIQTSTMKFDDVRITRGKVLYSNDFVPPTSELSNSTSSKTPGITVLLLNCNGTNGSTTFTDSGQKTLSPTVNGNAQISTAQSMFGGASAYFDGTGDYLSYSTGKNNFNLFDSNFTIEAWVRLSSVTGARVIFSKRVNTATYGGFVFQINGNKLNIVATKDGASWGINIDSSSTLSTNVWYHVAATRLYDTFKIFIDGSEVGSQTISDFVIAGNTDNMVIGAGSAAGGQEFFGYIDDLRLIRGVSLYNSSFTKPSSQLSIYP